jgi:DNA-binding SARP family transcriptional activator
MVQVQLFGTFSIERADSDRITVDLAARPLASYLFSFPNQSHRREKVIDIFWRDSPEKVARASLCRAVWRIRRQLSPCTPQGIHLHANQDALWLKVPDASVIDAHHFRGAAVEALSPKPAAIDMQALGRAVSVYKGPFLEEYDEDWVLDQRERFQSLYLRALATLMTLYAHRKHTEDAIVCGKRILACDPMRETIQRALMVLYVLNGQRGEAILQFERCKKALKEECDVDPAPETCSLFKLIRSGEVYDKISILFEKALAFSFDAGSPLISW